MKQEGYQKTKNPDCRIFRQILEDSHDAGQPIPETAAAHVNACPECREFGDFLASNGKTLAMLLDGEGSQIAAPDFRDLFLRNKQRSKRRRIAITAAGIAAVLLISVGSYWGMRASKEVEDHRLFETETHQFVDNLFSEPLLDGVEYINAGQ